MRLEVCKCGLSQEATILFGPENITLHVRAMKDSSYWTSRENRVYSNWLLNCCGVPVFLSMIELSSVHKVTLVWNVSPCCNIEPMRV